jgi:hypothetical protein
MKRSAAWGALALLSSVLVFSSCSSSFKPDPAVTEGESDAFTIVALPDTQYYSARMPEIFERQTRWIAENAARLNVRAILGLGDIVDDGGDVGQWRNAMRAIEPLKSLGLPFWLAIGNHDYDGAGLEVKPLRREVRHFNSFLGPQFYEGVPGYGGAMERSHENFYGTFRAARRDYLVIALEFSPRDRALEWASRVVESRPAHDVIVITHSYLYNNHLRVTRCANHTKRAYGMDGDNDGEEVWAKFASRHPRVRLVLSGHIPKIGVARRFSLGESGNLVNELLSDYQNEPNAGNGWLRILTVRPGDNRIDVATYSPYLDQWKTDEQNQFALDYEKPREARFSEGTIHGIVRSYGEKDRCKPIEGVTVRFPGGVAKTDAEGKFTAVVTRKKKGAVYQGALLEASKPGWKPASVRATVRDGTANWEQVYLVPGGQ